MKMLTRSETADFFRSHDNYCILTHRRPDGDTLGSSAALCRILRTLGKTAHILENTEVTPRYSFLHEGLTVEAPGENDTLVSVDVASPQMLPESSKVYLQRIALRIDHHDSATSFTPEELVDPKAGACAEIIWDLARELGVTMDSATADAMYTAVSTDTGCFRFSNTTEHTFRVAADCSACGARVFELNQEIFETVRLTKLKMQSWIVEHMDLFCDGKLALVAIPKAVEEKIGVTEDDMENISSFPRNIAGVCMAATLRQSSDGKTKLSVRAVPGYDATKVAGVFGGGGHKGAAGASAAMSLEEMAQAVKSAMINR